MDDEATNVFMKRFHESLSKGSPADVALAEAARYVRSKPKWRDPYFWAAFQLVGDGLR